MTKILLTSDWHETPFAEKKFESQEKNWVEILIQKFHKPTDKNEIIKLMKEVIKKENIKLVIGNGDIQESTFNERGLSLDEDLKSARKIVQSFEEETQTKTILNMGNHESGYNLALSSDPGRGMFKKSVDNFLLLSERNELYYSFMQEKYRIILLPYLFSEESAKDFDINSEEEKIIQRLQSDFAKNVPIILILHSAEDLVDQRLFSLIQNNREKIKMIFAGHYHAEYSVKILKYASLIFNKQFFSPLRWILMLILKKMTDPQIAENIKSYFIANKNIPKIIDDFKIHIIPSPGGLFGAGGGFFVLDLESLKLEKYS